MLKCRTQPEQMRYKPNSFPSWMCMVAIVFNVLHFIIIYSNKKINNDFVIGIDIFINIIFMMLVFLGSVKTKAYDLKWSYFIALIAVVELARIFLVPIRFLGKGELSGKEFALSIIFLIAAAVVLLVGAITSWIKSKVLSEHLKKIEQESVGRAF